jgi:hypothetical protein
LHPQAFWHLREQETLQPGLQDRPAMPWVLVQIALGFAEVDPFWESDMAIVLLDGLTRGLLMREYESRWRGTAPTLIEAQRFSSVQLANRNFSEPKRGYFRLHIEEVRSSLA